MSDNSETKQIILTGDAAQSMSGGKKRRSRKNNQSAGGSTQAGTIVQLQSTSSSSDNSTAAVTGVNNSKLAQVSSAPIQNAGGKVKVILNQPKKKTQKVILSVGKLSNLKPLSTPLKNKTRKTSKQIKFSLKNLSKKLNTAKTIKKHAEEKSISEIKKTLEDAKLIKVGSKAPEQMIRQIYNDYMTLKHKAL